MSVVIQSRYKLSAKAYDSGITRLVQMPEVEALRGSRVCIVGSTGLIGSALTAVLLAANEQNGEASPINIHGIARRPSQAFAGVKNYKFTTLALTEPQNMMPLSDIDYYVFIAGSPSDALRRPSDMIATHTTGLEWLLSHASGCQRFVFLSSTLVYGLQPDLKPLTEESQAQVVPMHLQNIFDSSKRLGESLCLWHTANRDLPSVVLRLGNVYGPPAMSSHSETFISAFVRQALNTGMIHLTGHRESIRNYVCVLDVVQGILKALVTGRVGEAYNIVSYEHMRAFDVAECVADEIGSSTRVFWQPNPAIEPTFQLVSLAKAQKELGFVPQHKFRQLIPYLVETTANSIRLSNQPVVLGGACY
jgi:UDP-glucuronate decarboxylase